MIQKIVHDRAERLTDYIGKCYVEKPDINGKTYQADLIHLVNGLENIGWKVEFMEDYYKHLDAHIPVFGDIPFVDMYIKKLIPEFEPLSTYPEFAQKEWVFHRKLQKVDGSQVCKMQFPFFIKSVHPKKYGYAGTIVRNKIDLESETPILRANPLDMYWVSEVMYIDSTEWRVLVCEGQIAGIAPYLYNSYKCMYSPPNYDYINLVTKLAKNKGVTDFSFDVALCSFKEDSTWVSKDDKVWTVIEFNDGYAFGNYGFDDMLYAQVHINWWFNTMKRYGLLTKDYVPVRKEITELFPQIIPLKLD